MVERIGIISGVAFELEAFLPESRSNLIELEGVGVRSLVHADKQIFLACEGIGKVAAATAASVLAMAAKVELLIVIGTAGKIGSRPENLFKISQAFEADYGAQQGDRFVHYTAGMLPIGRARLQMHNAMLTPTLLLPEAKIATSDAFIESTRHAAYLQSTFQADLVDMETSAVAHVASRTRLPWCAIKATTDDADENSAANFHTNLAIAARAAASAAEAFIASF